MATLNDKIAKYIGACGVASHFTIDVEKAIAAIEKYLHGRCAISDFLVKELS